MREFLLVHRMSMVVMVFHVYLQVGASFIQTRSLPVLLRVPACLGSRASSGWFAALAAT